MFRNSTSTICHLCFSCGLCLAAHSSGLAQSGSRNISGGAVGGATGGAASGGGSTVDPTQFAGGSSQSSPATSAESVARGQADLFRSLGQGVLHASEAAVNYEEARKRRIENQVTGSDAYNQVMRNRITSVNLQREYRRARLSRNYERPMQPVYPRLQASWFDRGTGDITWPASLRIPHLAKSRRRVERLFAERIDTDDYLAVDALLRTALMDLDSAWKRQVRRTRPNIYASGKNFILGLRVETHHLPGPDVFTAELSGGDKVTMK